MDNQTKINIEEKCWNALGIAVEVWTDDKLIIVPCHLTDLEYIVKVIKEETKQNITGKQIHQLLSDIDEFAQFVYQAQIKKGFYDDEPLDDQDKNPYLGNKLMLMVGELSEAHEAIRKNIDKSEHIPEFTGLEEEIADTVIRLLDFAGYNKLRLGEAIKAKLIFNESRPPKHGKNF